MSRTSTLSVTQCNDSAVFTYEWADAEPGRFWDRAGRFWDTYEWA